MFARPTALVIGTADVLTAGLVVFGVFVALPARWWPVDSVAATLAGLELASAFGLFTRARWAERMARITGAISLAIGLGTVTILASTASWLSGVYGPVGRGGAIVFALVAALAFPYLVALPVAQLLWLRQGGPIGGRAAERS